MTEARAASALEGWRVLEVADGMAASFCAKVLGDLGADVVKVEPPGGHPSRWWGPRRPRRRSRRAGWPVLVPQHREGECRRPGRGRGRGAARRTRVGVRRRGHRPPRALFAWVHATRRRSWWRSRRSGSPARTRPIGRTTSSCSTPVVRDRSCRAGPGWKRFPERPPVQIGSDIAEYDAGWNAAVAVLAACYDRLRTGRGQRIDVSVQESELTLNRTRLSRFNNDGVTLHREGSRYGFFGMIECRDGWVQLVGLTPDQWDTLAASPTAATSPIRASPPRPRGQPTWVPRPPRSSRGAGRATRPRSCAS